MKLEGPTRMGESNSYVWTALVPALDQEDVNAYSFQVGASDALGNTGDPQPLADLDGVPLELRLDVLAPVLEPSLVTELPRGLYGLEDFAPDGDNSLAFDFVVTESLPLLSPTEESPCGDCPIVKVGGKAVGEVTRTEFDP
jgi:hypothetical protein